MLAAALLALATGVLAGTVTRGPTQPVCRAGEPCSEPAAGVGLVLEHGAARWRTRTDAAGRFRLVLPSGTYAVRLAHPQPVGGLKPTEVAVRAARTTRVAFDLDTGIR